jgi:DNA-binding CsgD family transcriptional regulator
VTAAGMTNREVADGLYMSVKTVEHNLRNSYIKLGITSRRVLGADDYPAPPGRPPGGN